MKNNNNNQGFIVGSLLVLILVVSVLLVTISSAAIGNFQNATKANARINAQFAADSGLDQGLHELNIDETWTGTTGEVTLFTSTDSDVRSTYEITVSAGSSATRKIIRSTGRTYKPASSTTPEATRIFELEAEAVTSGTGPGSVVSGVGGLILNNNSKITGGDVVVNGNVTVNNNAQIGLSTNPVNLRVAHQSCPSPVDATYPQVCTSGQPITNSGNIYADVRAQNQTNSSGMSSPGLVSNAFPPIAVPGYDRPAHKAAVVSTYTSTNSTIRCNNNQSKTWPANVKITGNISLGNNCTVTILGDVWITGNVTFGNNAEIVIADSLGTTRPIIMIDGSSGLDTGNNTDITPNSTGTGAEVITVWWNTNTSTNGGFDCGGIPDPYDCTAVTGLALSSSQSNTTIDLSNNTDASNTVFRTLWSRAYISNNGALGAVAGQTIQLGNNAVINFTASIPGSDNLVQTWVKRGYLRVFQ
jgi:hypothetical protein